MSSSSQPPLLDAPEHVLSTLEHDGRRRWLNPRLSTGDWWKKRRIVAYALMIVFVVLPHIRVGGKPLILLDIAARKFTIFGRTFLPNDTLVLALFMLLVFVSIVLITAVAGRAWCGWACPQTVYMEFLFRPIDRLFYGTIGKGGKPRNPISGLRQLARFLVYLALSMFLAHTFLAYFVGTDRLAQWVRSSPIEHPTAFLVMAATTGLMLFDFLFFREQLCTIACPYGRFQSVMLDRQSLIVGYDPGRGEPRKKGKRINGENAGDCVDCNQCVVVCPTGIDIRDGLQMECINCTQCIDACDNVMDRVGKPRGLIRFSSQDGLAGKANKLVRPRTLIYPAILAIVFGGLAYAINDKSGFDARVIRGKGAPFTRLGDGQVSNPMNLRLVNRTDIDQLYSLEITSPDSAVLEVIDLDALQLKPGQSVLVPLQIRFPSSLTTGKGNASMVLSVTDQSDNQRSVDFKMLGPR